MTEMKKSFKIKMTKLKDNLQMAPKLAFINFFDKEWKNLCIKTVSKSNQFEHIDLFLNSHFFLYLNYTKKGRKERESQIKATSKTKT